MAHQQFPTISVPPGRRQVGLDPGPAPEPALHLHGGSLWVASCPSCGLELARARTQERCERRAAGRTCPICRGDDAA
jgi:hypothetical protein